MAFWDRKPKQRFERDTRLDQRQQAQAADPGLSLIRQKTSEAEAKLHFARIQQRNLEKFKTQYPQIDLQNFDTQPKAQATSTASGQGQFWGWGYPRGYGSKFPGGMSTPFAGIAINHWQLRQQARDTAFDAPHAQALISRFADSTVEHRPQARANTAL